MALTPDDILEELLDELALGELGQSTESFAFTRLGPGAVRLDYGALGRFRLTIASEGD